jgi:hypothetical protein
MTRSLTPIDMSAVGTKRTCRDCCCRTATGGKWTLLCRTPPIRIPTGRQTDDLQTFLQAHVERRTRTHLERTSKSNLRHNAEKALRMGLSSPAHVRRHGKEQIVFDARGDASIKQLPRVRILCSPPARRANFSPAHLEARNEPVLRDFPGIEVTPIDSNFV